MHTIDCTEEVARILQNLRLLFAGWNGHQCNDKMHAAIVVKDMYGRHIAAVCSTLREGNKQPPLLHTLVNPRLK